MKRFIAAFLLLATHAFAQSTPNWTQGYIPPPSEWNSLWASKQNYNGPFGGVVVQLPTGAFFSQNGAIIDRFNDRVLVGGATVSDGAFPGVTNDWLSNFVSASGIPGAVPVSVLQVETQPNASSAVGAIAITGGAQSLFSTNIGTTTIPIQSIAVNNNTTLATLAYGFYGECHYVSSVAGPCYGAELDTRTLFAGGVPSPYQQAAIVGLQLASGAGRSASGQFDAGAAIQIESNPKAFVVGINFGSTAITGCTGTSGTCAAIDFGMGQALEWFDAAGTNTANIVSSVTGLTSTQSLQFTNTGTAFFVGATPAIPTLSLGIPAANAVNGLAIVAAATGSAPLLLVDGSDTNVSLGVSTKGTGTLIINGVPAVTCSGAPSGSFAVTNGIVTHC